MFMYVEEPAKLYDNANPDWIPSQQMKYETETPDQERLD